MKRILNFWIRLFAIRLMFDNGDPNAGGGGGSGGGGGGGLLNQQGGGVDWRADLPEDIRQDPSLASFKAKDHREALGQIAKSLVHAQKLVGVDKIAKPNDKWTKEQWAAYHREIGVPEAPDKYGVPEFKFAEGLSLDRAELAEFQKVFHEAGLTPKQASAVMSAYFTKVNGKFVQTNQQLQQAMKDGETALREEFGDKYDAKLDVARSVVRKFGGEELVAKLENAGLASDPLVIKMLAQLGEQMLEDNAGGSGDGLLVQEATHALQEINRLKTDKEFQDALNTRNNPGHKAAVQRWLELHQAAARRKD